MYFVFIFVCEFCSSYSEMGALCSILVVHLR